MRESVVVWVDDTAAVTDAVDDAEAACTGDVVVVAETLRVLLAVLLPDAAATFVSLAVLLEDAVTELLAEAAAICVAVAELLVEATGTPVSAGVPVMLRV